MGGDFEAVGARSEDGALLASQRSGPISTSGPVAGLAGR